MQSECRLLDVEDMLIEENLIKRFREIAIPSCHFYLNKCYSLLSPQVCFKQHPLLTIKC